jgi:hypothetical protein
MAFHDSFDWSNAGVGVAGLVLTVITLIQATGAKEAANEARKAIWQREASESFSDIERLASELTQNLMYERWRDGFNASRKLMTDISKHRQQFVRFLSNEDEQKLSQVEVVFQQLAGQLSDERAWKANGKPQDAIRSVLDASRELNGVYGRLLQKQQDAANKGVS